MKIAVASQNRAQITKHTGRCRKFWIYEIAQGRVAHKKLLELPKAQSFHDSSPHEPHPLDDAQALIAGNMGAGLVRRLEAKDIKAVITPETDPDQALAAYLDGSLVVGVPDEHEHRHDHNDSSEHGHECHCGE